MTTGSGYRTVNRFVSYDIELTGDPVVWTSRHSERSVLVKTVRLRFGHGDDGFFIEANVQGRYLSKTGRPLKERADEYTGTSDLWPTWLKALADEHQAPEYAEHRGLLPTEGGVQ